MNKPQKKTKPVIPKTLFIGLCRSIASEIGCRLRFDSVATDALQVACEAYLVDFFTGNFLLLLMSEFRLICSVLNLTAVHANRVKVMADDVVCVKQLMNLFKPTPNKRSTRN